MIQALLGLYPYAPLNALFIDPHLPDWLPQVRLRNVRVGLATADIEFLRAQDGETSYRVSQISGKLHVVQQPSPWSLTATLPERLVDALSGMLPGH
jgi:hypothetical protein